MPDATEALNTMESPEVALRRFARKLVKLAGLHQPYRIYGECDHAHAYEGDEARERAGVIDCGDFVTCEDGYMYSVCRECCVNEGQTEACADGHHHDVDRPICPTAAILNGSDDE